MSEPLADDSQLLKSLEYLQRAIANGFAVTYTVEQQRTMLGSLSASVARAEKAEAELATIYFRGIPVRAHSDEAWRKRTQKLEAEVERLRQALEKLRDYGARDDEMAHANGILEPGTDGYVHDIAKAALEAKNG